MRKHLLICTLLLLFHKTYAKPEIAGYPSLGYSNETGFFGGGSVYLRYRSTQFDETVPKNVFYLTTEYSQKKQFSLKFEPEIRLLNGLYTISTKLKYKYWPSNFYGIGNDNNKNNSVVFESIKTLNSKLHQRISRTKMIKVTNQFCLIIRCKRTNQRNMWNRPARGSNMKSSVDSMNHALDSFTCFSLKSKFNQIRTRFSALSSSFSPRPSHSKLYLVKSFPFHLGGNKLSLLRLSQKQIASLIFLYMLVVQMLVQTTYEQKMLPIKIR